MSTEFWVSTPHMRFHATPAYLRGAKQAQNCLPFANPYKPGPALAQYNYGYANERAGHHDLIDLPFYRMVQDDPNDYFKVTRR